LLAIHSSGADSVEMQDEPQFDGRAEVRPSSTPDETVVRNHRLSARLCAAPVPLTTRPLSLTLTHALICPGVGHQIPSSGTNEPLPLNPVAVTPGTGPAIPGVVFISVAGGSSVVRSSTGIRLRAALAPAGSSSRQ
jgi:hypothetical protein